MPLKQFLKPTKTMNNNQSQPTNQIKFNRFRLKTWQWVSVLVVVAVIVAGVFVLWNRGTQISPQDEYKQKITEGNKIKQAIKEANFCNTADDCVLLGEYCPFSNSWKTYVNKAEKEKMQKMIEDFQKKAPRIFCEPSICNNVSPVQCVEGKCYVECRYETITQNKCDGLTEEECGKNPNCSPHIIMADPTGSQYAGCLEKTPTQWAEEKGDYTFCDQEEKEQPKWRCYILVAEKNKDLSICDKIKDEERIQQCYQTVRREINANQPVTKSVSITTDKTEYEEKEDVKVIVSNNLNIPLYIYDCDPLELAKAEDNSHVPGGLECEPNLTLGIKPQESKNLVKPLSYYSGLKGKFKIKLSTYLACDETIKNWQYRPEKACEGLKRFYSNEFAIRVQVGQKVDDLDLAQEVLIEYFSLLNEGKYTEAVKYHGSGYDYMNTAIGYETKLDPSNPAHYPELLKRDCGFLVCENINIVKKEQVSTNEFVFTVQFVNEDGSLVKSYPYCCGEEPPEGVANIPKTEFEYKVKKVGANFLVITPLLYIP